MTTPTNRGPAQSGSPTTAEIAALTARLRELSARDSDVDPAERAAFLADKDALLARITENDETRDDDTRDDETRGAEPQAGFVPHLGAEPGGRYETVSPSEAAERIAAAGFDRDDAQTMVEQYLEDTTARHGEPPASGWVIDQYDLAEIARRNEWVDHHRGETLADARERAGRYAQNYTRQAATIDRTREPGRAAHTQQEATRWAERAAPATGDAGGPTVDDERREQLARWHAEDHADAPDDASVQFTSGGYDPDLGRD